ncbi:hypothetical protein EG328_005480 [Venturia inaequalis]|uniref:RING-type domain-containing protein n=1 Tax=Venturia inaequalis TaxID=5025 RepID=A0A8H3UL95_VENIN|nr:hypothetical protein EG328_005480 [Venturia inaequalis]
MFEEIERARKKAEAKQSLQKKENEQRMIEAEAREVSAYKGNLVECDICAEDRPPNRMAGCDTKDQHTYCFACVKTHIETILGDGKYVAVCMESGCKGRYPRQVLKLLLDKTLIARMERLQQNADLKGIKGIEECPLCNFKAICDTPLRFDCRNPECLMSSCLKCKAETHPGLSCAEYANKKNEDEGGDKGMRLRHLVEEAMSEALMRRCPQCGTPFTKDQGCNKMICPAFKQAEEEAKEKVKRENPEVTDEDLKFAMSDQVKEDDKHRLARENRALRGEGWHFGMPIEGEDEDIEEEMFDMWEMGGMRNRPFQMRGPVDHFFRDDMADPFNQDFNLDERFDGGILGQRNPFHGDFRRDLILEAPLRRQRPRREEPNFNRVRFAPPLANIIREQHFLEDDMADLFDEDLVLDQRFDGDILGLRHPFNRDPTLEAPPRRQQPRREEPHLDRVRVAPPRVNVVHQQEANFNHQVADRPRINPEHRNRDRQAAEQIHAGAGRRVAAPMRQPTGGAQRPGQRPPAEAARAAALARERRGA